MVLALWKIKIKKHATPIILNVHSPPVVHEHDTQLEAKAPHKRPKKCQGLVFKS